MDLDDYQKHAMRTAPRDLRAYPIEVRAAAAALENSGQTEAAADLLKTYDTLVWGQGLAGEAGEVCDLLKKVKGHGKPYDATKMLHELGDVLWYLATLSQAHGFTLSQVAEANVAKLRARYRNGFTVEAANSTEQTSPCGGTRCFLPSDAKKWIHSSESYGTCSVVRSHLNATKPPEQGAQSGTKWPSEICRKCYGEGFGKCQCNLDDCTGDCANNELPWCTCECRECGVRGGVHTLSCAVSS